MDCQCLEHVVASSWLDLTGDSYRCQVDLVYNASGAGKYLSKYFSKTFVEHEEMVRAGFPRRYSFSRNFPQLERIQLEGTVNGDWSGVQRWGKLRSGRVNYVPDLEVKRTDLPRVGERYLIDEARVRKAKKLVKLISSEKELE